MWIGWSLVGVSAWPGIGWPIGSVQTGLSCSFGCLSLAKTQISWCLWGVLRPAQLVGQPMVPVDPFILTVTDCVCAAFCIPKKLIRSRSHGSTYYKVLPAVTTECMCACVCVCRKRQPRTVDWGHEFSDGALRLAFHSFSALVRSSSARKLRSKAFDLLDDDPTGDWSVCIIRTAKSVENHRCSTYY